VELFTITSAYTKRNYSQLKAHAMNTSNTNQEIYTRAEYIKDSNTDGMKAHRRYFGQFVTAGTKSRVLNSIGLDRILSSTNEHFNDIPLRLWDILASKLPGSSGFCKAGDYYTLANGVCLAKEAAKQIKEAHEAHKTQQVQQTNKAGE
jgi:hypothetical protein